MIIDYTFFQDGLLMVDGAMALATPSPTNKAIAGRIESYINQYESEYLCKLLGEELYNDFLSNEDSEQWEAFKKLIVKENGRFKTSPIANYVYFFFVRDSQSKATVNGVKSDGDENLVSSGAKLVSAWNNMVFENRKIYMWLCNKFHNVPTEPELLETINSLGV